MCFWGFVSQVIIYRVRVNFNLKGITFEQLVERRKVQHFHPFDFPHVCGTPDTESIGTSLCDAQEPQVHLQTVNDRTLTKKFSPDI